MTPHDSNSATPERPAASGSKWVKWLFLSLGAVLVLLLIAALYVPHIEFPCGHDENQSSLRQIGLLCRIYAGDNDGQFPVQYTTNGVNITEYEGLPPTQNSNEAFRALFAKGYTKEEKTFYTDSQGLFLYPDAKIGTEENYYQDALSQGECSFIYFAGLKKFSETSMPLACNAVRGKITYETGKGWIAHDLYPQIHKGKGINVLRVDGSVSFENVRSDGTVLLGGVNDKEAAQIKVLYPLVRSLVR